jgi:TrmH family RNA methyltransferase
MLSHNQAKHIRSLKLAKYRKLHGQFIAEGIKLAEELLESDFEVQQLFGVADWIERNQEKLSQLNVPVHQISDKELARVSLLSTPNEVLLLVKIPEEEDEIIPKDLMLYLDRIQDPGNLGAILRTADWFGIQTIICSPGCADLYNPKVVQSTMGSITRVRVMEREPQDFLKKVGKSVAVYGTMKEGENIYGSELKVPALILIGNESQGISDKLIPLINNKIGIPGRSDKAESLNAAVATGIILSEFRRRTG